MRHRTTTRNKKVQDNSKGNIVNSSPFFSSTQTGKENVDGSTVQPKLTINQPNDACEREADAIAQQITQNPVDENKFFKPVSKEAQGETNNKMNQQVQLKEDGATVKTASPTLVNDVVNSGDNHLIPIQEPSWKRN